MGGGGSHGGDFAGLPEMDVMGRKRRRKAAAMKEKGEKSGWEGGVLIEASKVLLLLQLISFCPLRSLSEISEFFSPSFTLNFS